MSPPKDRDRDWRYRSGDQPVEAEAHDERSGVHDSVDAHDEHPEITELKSLVRRTRGALFSKLEDFGGRLDSFESDIKSARAADINFRRDTSKKVSELQAKVQEVETAMKSAEIKIDSVHSGVGQLLMSSRQDEATRDAREKAAMLLKQEAEDRAASRKRENMKASLTFWVGLIAAISSLLVGIGFLIRGNPPSVTVPQPVPTPVPTPILVPVHDAPPNQSH